MTISDRTVVRMYEYKGVQMVLIEESDKEGYVMSAWHFVVEGKEHTSPSLKGAMGRVDDALEGEA